jgi:hypothetical protein
MAVNHQRIFQLSSYQVVEQYLAPSVFLQSMPILPYWLGCPSATEMGCHGTVVALETFFIHLLLSGCFNL